MFRVAPAENFHCVIGPAKFGFFANKASAAEQQACVAGAFRARMRGGTGETPPCRARERFFRFGRRGLDFLYKAAGGHPLRFRCDATVKSKLGANRDRQHVPLAISNFCSLLTSNPCK